MGNPWECGINGHDGIHGRNMILHLMSALASRSWAAVISADVSAKYVDQDKGEDFPIDVDSIFFTYDPAAAVAPPPPYPQPYSQPFGQPFGQPYPQPPAYGFTHPSAPPAFNPSYGAYPNQ